MADTVSFITGGNKGIGLETARGLAKLGHTVLIGSRDLDAGEAAAAKLKGDGKVRAVKFDVTNLADHQTVADVLSKEFGHLDVLINNAGIAIDEADFGPDGANTATTVSQEVLLKTFDTNFFKLIALTQTLLPLIRKSPAGRIVNLSSILASLTLHSDPKSDIYKMKAFAYDASKTALNAFTVHLAAALADTKIKVNSAHPGWVQTDMGGQHAPMNIVDGAKTSIALATLPADGPTGAYIHMGKPLPW